MVALRAFTWNLLPLPAAQNHTDAAHWVRIAAVSDLAGPRPLIPVTLNGQSLVLFRDDAGALGLIGRHCPHRGADLCFGRLEDNGLRCPFHGWHFDRTGQCVEQPAEPEDSVMYKAIKVPMIPVAEGAGVILAYTGPDGPPDGSLPDPDFAAFANEEGPATQKDPS